MKRIISSALVILLTIGAAQAQTAEGRPKIPNREQKAKGFDQLNLTADQKTRMQALREDFKKGMADLKSNQQLSEEERKTRRKALHDQFRSQSEAVLTPAQKDQLSKMKTERREAGRNTKANRDGRGRLANRGLNSLPKELNLTTEQQSRISNLRFEFRSKFETLRKDNALSQDSKREKMRELTKQQFDQMKSVLTADQIQKLESLRGQRNKKKNS